MEEGERLYGAYRGLYPGIFTWGDEVLKKSLQTGYIESAMGFKLKLPFFDLFQSREKAIKAKSKQFWEMYREGKNEYKLLWATKEKQEKDPSIPDYVIENEISYNVFKNNKKEISDYFKTKSEYSRLCLNNPCQATAAHQSKLAMVKIFDYIKRNDLLYKVKICNFIYDELVFEVVEEEVERMLPVIGKLMREAANSLLKSGLVSMEADAHAGDSWYEAK